MSSPLTRAIDLLDSTAMWLERFAVAADEQGLTNTARNFRKKADELRREIAVLNEVEPV